MTEMVPVISATITSASMLIALVGLIATQWRNSKRDGNDIASALAVMKSDLKYIRDSIDELKNNYVRLEERLGKAESRIAHLEERVEVPIRRLDRLDGDHAHDA